MVKKAKGSKLNWKKAVTIFLLHSYSFTNYSVLSLYKQELIISSRLDGLKFCLNSFVGIRLGEHFIFVGN